MPTSSKEDGRAPKVRMASSLEDAGAHDVVYVDAKGVVLSPARYWATMALYLFALVAVCAALAALLFMSFGSVGPVAVALMTVWVIASVVMGFRLRSGVLLLAGDRVERARAVFEGVARSRITHGATRAMAEQGVAMCLAIDGDHPAALERSRAALARFGARPRHAQARLYKALCLHGEVTLLVNLGQMDEARAKLAALGPEPEGEYLRLQRYTTELYFALAEGKCTLGDEALYERSRAALSITTATALLGLSAWAYMARGDLDMSEHLLYAALDRHPGRKLSGPMPRLEEWMQKRSAELRAKSN